MREPARYYEPLYFYDGHIKLTDENQQYIVELLDKNSAVGIYGVFVEKDYPIYCMSGFAMTTLGYTFDEMMEVTEGKFINLVYEKDRQAVAESFEENGAVEIEFRLITKGDKPVWAHSFRRQSVSLDGQNVFLASVRVIDDTVRRESELLAALAKEYGEIIYVDQKRGKCRRVKTSIAVDEPIGTVDELQEKLREHMTIIHPEDHAFEEVYERLQNLTSLEMDRGGDYRATYRAKLDGEYVWLQFRAIFGGNMNLDTGHIIMIFKRVDKEVQRELDANRILSESLARAEEAGRIKNQFLSRMSHDLRTPLNGILGMVDITKKNADKPEKVVECSQKIKISCQHLMSLVNDVLDMSNLERGKVEFEDIPFDFMELVEEESKYLRAKVSERGLVFESRIQAFGHRNVIGSPKHIRQIFAHILDNAVEYNKPGGEIRIWGREVSNSHRLAVFEFVFEDTGCGMSPEFVKRLFEPFEQEHKDARTNYEGTGLGMAIVKKMVDQMNGDIIVESKQNEGTRVTVTFPLKVCNEGERLDSDEGDVDVTGMKALLVEDNELNMEIAKFMLEDMGLEVFTAENGQDAVDMVEESENGFYDVVFMDLMMPVMDGYEASRTIRAMKRKDAASLPIIALSANVLDEDIRKSKMAGMNEHLAKPIEADQILSALRKYFRRR